MAGPREQVRAARALLAEVCALMSAHADDAVLIGGWVPDLRFPDAIPAHVGSIDIDFVVRSERKAHEAVVALLLRSGFRRGAHPYQFLKDVPVGGGRVLPARLDLLSGEAAEIRAAGTLDFAPQYVRGADIAFRDNSIEGIGPDAAVQARVAGIASFIVMKSIALAERAKSKDAYDIHFCLEHHPDGLTALAGHFDPLRGLDIVEEALRELARRFRNEEDIGPRMVADVEEVLGDARAIRKLVVAERVREFLARLDVSA